MQWERGKQRGDAVLGAGLRTDPGVVAPVSGDPPALPYCGASAAILGSRSRIGSVFKGLFPTRSVFVLTNRRHVFELELVETGWLLRQHLIDAGARCIESKVRGSG